MTVFEFFGEAQKGYSPRIGQQDPPDPLRQRTRDQTPKLRCEFRPKTDIGTQQNVMLSEGLIGKPIEGDLMGPHLDGVQTDVRLDEGKDQWIRIDQHDVDREVLGAIDPQQTPSATELHDPLACCQGILSQIIHQHETGSPDLSAMHGRQ
nr:hypothetical protein [Imhoffiella purpurea]